MAAPKITRKPKITKSSGSSGGGLKGAGLGAAIGGVAGAFIGGPAGAAAGASLGQSLGGTAGGLLQPAKAGSIEQNFLPEVPGAQTRSSFQIANESQQLLDGIRSLDSYPNLAKKYSKDLASAYIQTQVQLKQMG